MTGIPDASPLPDTYNPATVVGAAAIANLLPWMTLHMAWLIDQGVGSYADPIWQLVMGSGEDDGVTPTVGTLVGGVLVTDGYDPPYGGALDPQRALAGYGYIGQYVGVAIPAGTNDATAKSLVLEEAGMSRGTDAAMIAAAKRFLNGTKSVTILPRTYADGSTPFAGWFCLVVLASEVVNAAGLTAAVNAVKFGDLGWTLIQSTGHDWQTVKNNNPTWNTVLLTGYTWDNVRALA